MIMWSRSVGRLKAVGMEFEGSFCYENVILYVTVWEYTGRLGSQALFLGMVYPGARDQAPIMHLDQI